MVSRSRGLVRFDFMVRIRPESKGWLCDVLACVQSLPTGLFTLEDAYSFESKLGELHPSNQNVRPKIRQQLQVLVAEGIIRRERPGVYVVVKRTGEFNRKPLQLHFSS